MTDLRFAPVCGIYCGHCAHLGERCQGCGEVDGKPFWTVQMPGGVCPLYECCRNRRNHEHCGLCPEFPCRTFLELRDPSMSDAEFQKSLQDREDTLRRRAEIGTAAWIAEKSAR